jgi:mersacidin/lichenicidin family type 2 lantibiotic
MSHIDVIRAWTDPEYRSTLSNDQLSALPSHPAGLIELSDEELERAAGLATVSQTTAQTCTEFTFRGFRRCCPK